MRNSRALLLVVSCLAAGDAAAQSTLNVVVVPPASGVVIPPRSAGPRLAARPPSAGPVTTIPQGPAVSRDTGTGLTAPAIGAIVLPAIAAALLAGGVGGSNGAAGVGRGGGTLASGPARTR